MARQDIRARLAGSDPTRANLRKRLSQLGDYNLSHRKGEPIGEFNATHVAGELISPQPGAPTRGGAVPASRDHALDPAQAGWNRHNAPVGPVPPWVLAQMQAVPGGVPEGVVPTKPQGPNPPYPLRRPQSVPHQGQVVNRRRRNQMGISGA